MKIENYEKHCYSSWICHEVRRVDEELPEAIVEDRGEYYLRKDAGRY
jgi:hypothetical protein